MPKSKIVHKDGQDLEFTPGREGKLISLQKAKPQKFEPPQMKRARSIPPIQPMPEEAENETGHGYAMGGEHKEI